jgi:hypothetical protein
MNPRKLAKVGRTLAKLRKGAPNRGQLESLAISLGRKRCKGSASRGKEPTYESTVFPHLRHLTIPDHSRDPGKGLAQSILDQLEEDVWEYRRRFEEKGGQ